MARPFFKCYPNAKVLVIRNDGLGDFVLTLPLVAALKHHAPHSQIDMLVHKNLASLGAALPEVHQFILDPGVLLKRHTQTAKPCALARERQRLQRRIAAIGYDVVLLPYAEKASAALAFASKAKLRVGPLRRWFFWRFNRFNTTSRRHSPLAEFSLNLQYLKPLGLPVHYVHPNIKPCTPPPDTMDWARNKPFILLHPYKRAQTAIAWPVEHFIALAQAYLKQGYAVGVVGDLYDTAILSRMFRHLPAVHLCCGLRLDALLGLMRACSLFVGNSSGPLHLAALAGTPHLGLFPQNGVAAPRRWRSLPMVGEQLWMQENLQCTSAWDSPLKTLPMHPTQRLLAPQVNKKCSLCEGRNCEFYNCLKTISVNEVLHKSGQILSLTSKRMML